MEEKHSDAAEKRAGEIGETSTVNDRAGAPGTEGDRETRDVKCDKPYPCGLP